MFIALLCALLSPTAPLPAPQPPTGRAVTTLEATSEPVTGEMPLKEHLPLAKLPDDRLTVEVRVRGEGPFRFLVDTGADRTAVSTQLATRLGLPRGAGVRTHSVTGSNQVRTASLRGLSVASRALPDVSAPLLDAEHVRADGILGTAVLRSALVRFDFRSRLLSISAQRRGSRSPASRDEIVAEGQRRAGRLIVTEAMADGRRVIVVLDTGSEVTIANRALMRALGPRATEGSLVELASVTGAKLPAIMMNLRELEIGRLQLTDLPIAFADAHTFKIMGLQNRPSILLGMNALKAFDSVTIDLGARKLRYDLPSGSGEAAGRRAS